MTYPIDIVYMWVDSNDPIWRAQRAKYTSEQKNKIAENTSAARWRNNNELRYSLRSVEKYAPWINHIYIITDNQRPDWLNDNHPKITIVDHREIMPLDVLPTFNSMAIETCIHKIASLSEYFILANDDLIFTANVTPSHFFKDDGKPIVRLRHFKRNLHYPAGSYHALVKRMQDMVHSLTGKLIALSPHHCFDAYRKSLYKYCIENIHKDKWQYTTQNRFRDENDMQRCFIDYYMIAISQAHCRKVHRYNHCTNMWQTLRTFITSNFGIDSRYITFNTPDYTSIMHKYNPLMICVNDDENTTEADYGRMKAFLDSLLPEKCCFEK